MTAPVIIFVYSRPAHTRQAIESLENNILADKTDVFIYADGPKDENERLKVDGVGKYIDALKEQHKFKSLTVRNSKVNKGLATSIISGVTEIIKKYGKVIVMEDDLVTSADFLCFMNKALNYYQDDKRIWSISGYTFQINFPTDYKHDIYLSYRGCSWGWATWGDRWEKVDWNVSDYKLFKNNFLVRTRLNRGGRDMAHMLDQQMQGEIDSWAIRWCYTQSKLNMLTVYPVVSRIKNIGLDGTGTHCGISSKYDSVLDSAPNAFTLEKIDIDKRIIKIFRDHYGTWYDHFKSNVKSILKILLKLYKKRKA